MADHLQRLTVAALLAQAAVAAPFSHKLHLQLKPDCFACHASVRESTRVEDNNLPKADACRGCHENATIRTPRVLMVAKFSHTQHLKLGNIAPSISAAIRSKTFLASPDGLAQQLDTKNPCIACHHGIETSEQTSHGNFPQMAECLVCHNKIEPPFSCSTCHAPDAQLKPATHTSDFVDRHSRHTVDKPGCAVCHGRRFTCMGCH